MANFRRALDEYAPISGEELGKLLREAESAIGSVTQRVEEFEEWSKLGFIDGSYAYDERRGAFVAVFSAALILATRTRAGIRLSSRLGGSKEPVPFILLPRAYGESRCSVIMRTFELLAALDAIKQGAEHVYLDGSFLSLLLTPSGTTRWIYSDLTSLLPKEDVLSFFIPALRKLSLAVDEELDLVEEKGARSVFIELLRKTTRLVRDTYYDALRRIRGASASIAAKRALLDYTALSFEEGAALATAYRLLEEASEREARLFWIAKDSDSRILAEALGLHGWYTDVSLLDYCWRRVGDAVLDVSRMARLSPVGENFVKPEVKGLLVEPGLAKKLYRKWGAYKIFYFKLTRLSPVFQLSYPAAYGRSAGEEAIGALTELKDNKYGYPRPLAYVHHMAVVSSDLARLLGDEGWRRARSEFERTILSSPGRRLAGLR